MNSISFSMTQWILTTLPMLYKYLFQQDPSCTNWYILKTVPILDLVNSHTQRLDKLANVVFPLNPSCCLALTPFKHSKNYNVFSYSSISLSNGGGGSPHMSHLGNLSGNPPRPQLKGLRVTASAGQHGHHPGMVCQHGGEWIGVCKGRDVFGTWWSPGKAWW